MLKSLSIALTLISAQSQAQTNAFEAFITKPNQSWRDDAILVFADGRCNTRFDAPYFRSSNLNCWYPVYKASSEYYVKINGLAPWSDTGRMVTGDNAGYSIPEDVWVMGRHEADDTVSYRKSMTLYRVSCSVSVAKFALLKRTTFGPSGTMLQDVNYKKSAMKVAIPGSKEEAIALSVCG